ncbi:MAG: hypothetical protein ACREUZ_20470 [Burkholderiales bacterium]
MSTTAILALMLGMGGTTAVFSLLDALLMRDLPVAKPHELVRLVERRPDGTDTEAFTLITHETLHNARSPPAGGGANDLDAPALPRLVKRGLYVSCGDNGSREKRQT